MTTIHTEFIQTKM